MLIKPKTTLINIYPEWYDADNGAIFEDLAGIDGAITAHPWLSHAEELDLEYIGNRSGDKGISPLISKLLLNNTANINPNALTTAQRRSVAKIILNRFNNKWARLYAVQSAEYNPINNYDMVETETPNITKKYSVSDDYSLKNERKNKTDYSVETEADTESSVYGFNSNAAIPSGDTYGSNKVRTQGDADNNVTTDEQTQTGYREEKESGTRSLTRSGNIGVTTSQQMLESEIALWEWNFIESVFSDIDTVLALPIYSVYERGICGDVVKLVSLNATENGEYIAKAYNADGFKGVHVAVSGSGSVLVPINITENGEYDPADYEADGFSSVTVSVPPTLFRQIVNRTIVDVTESDLSGVTTIGNSAFASCTALRLVSLPSSVTLIDVNGFIQSGITTLNFSHVIELGQNAFNTCRNLINLPSIMKVSKIGQSAFAAVSATSMTFSADLTSIGATAFSNCTALTAITFLSTTPPTLSNVNAFNNVTCPIYVPADSVTAYQTATNWSSLASRIQAIP